MAADRATRISAPSGAALSVPIGALLLLWPALWNGYPIVFADTGTYLSQAIHHYAGWDRPVFYSVFMLALHWTVTTWPVVVAQALLTVWILRLVCRVLAPGLREAGFVLVVTALAGCTWLPWIVSELMPDVFTPLLVLVLSVLALAPERLSRFEFTALPGVATFMIASQQSSVPLACGLVGMWLLQTTWNQSATRFLAMAGSPATGDDFTATAAPHSPIVMAGPGPAMTGGNHAATAPARRWLLLPPALAALVLCTVNLAAHHRFALSPFGNVFLLARVIYDGPGLAVLRRDCPAAGWRLCPFIDRLPATSDDFLWTQDSPLNLAGGPKQVSADADAMIRAAIMAEPAAELKAALANSAAQLLRFASGDGLDAWPNQVDPGIKRDFPPAEYAAYAAARQQHARLAVPQTLASLQTIVACAGISACLALLPMAVRRRARCAGFIAAVLIALPLSAAITGALSAPHDRYQSRIMWLPPFVASVSLISLRRPRRSAFVADGYGQPPKV